MGFGGSGGGSGSISGSTDVALNSPANQQVLAYDSSTSKWKNATMSGAGNTFQYVMESGGTYPNRPATTSVVVFIGSDQPANTGTTAGGTPAAVPGLDRWWTA